MARHAIAGAKQMILQSLTGLPAFLAYLCMLPAFFEDDPQLAALGYVRKPLHSREGANVEIVIGGDVVNSNSGPYSTEPRVLQAVAPLPAFDGNYAVLGSWWAGGAPAGLSVREDRDRITNNTSRFLPHAIV
jgi:glutathionylspermidine synthase